MGAGGLLGSDTRIRTAPLLAALSLLLDMAEGHTPGHAVRTCFVAMRLAAAMELPERERADLFYAALLKDAGGSSSGADLVRVFGTSDLAQKRAAALADPTRLGPTLRFYAVHPPRESLTDGMARLRRLLTAERDVRLIAEEVRVEQGGENCRRLGFGDGVASVVSRQAERWDEQHTLATATGRKPARAASILALASAAEVHATRRGPRAAERMLHDRRGRFYDPAMVDLLLRMGRLGLWRQLATPDLTARTLALEPVRTRIADDATVDRACLGFAEIADAKSPYTAGGSIAVAERVQRAAAHLRLDPGALVGLRRAVMLRDVGKLAVPNTLLDRPGPLNEEERRLVQRHPVLVAEALAPIEGLRDVAELVGRHHERSDGTGYGVVGGSPRLDPLVGLLAAADVLGALTAERPQRAALPEEQALDLLSKLPLDPVAVEALRASA